MNIENITREKIKELYANKEEMEALKEKFKLYQYIIIGKLVNDFEADLSEEEFMDAVDYIADCIYPNPDDELICDLIDSWKEDRKYQPKY